ncbi:MAG: outer membrane protein transport protein [Nitrospirae bacterium]|nr:outer membrane protein transport protein [Nitrospirota bacterium]
MESILGRRARSHLALCLAVLIGFAPARRAWAAGYTVPDTGARALGRGGAFVAHPTDLTAFYYNPAGLNAVENGALAGLWLIHTRASFQRAPEGGTTFEKEDNGSAFFFTIPALVVAHDFGVPRFKAAAGFVTPLSGGYKFDRRGPQRYSVIDSEVGEAFYGAGGAYEIVPGLSLGVEALFTWIYAQFDQAYTVSLNREDHPESDGFFHMNAEAVNVPTFMVGVRYARGRLHAGASYQPPISPKLKGDVSVQQDADFQTIPIRIDASKGITVPLDLPAQFRLGLGYEVTARVYVEGNFTYTQWEDLQELVADLESSTFTLAEPILGIIDKIDINDVVMPLKFENSYDVRLGADWHVLPAWTLRAGGLYETSAIPPQTQTPSLQDAPKLLLATGATWSVARWSFDLGLGYLFYEDRTVEDSEVEWVNALEDMNLGPAKSVGNGTYEHAISNLSLAATYRW